MVGHQPTLGRIAARLIGGSEQDWTIRKANAWWIVRREHGDGSTATDPADHYLRAVMSPELVTNWSGNNRGKS